MITMLKNVWVYETRSGAVYVHVGSTLVRFAGYGVKVFALESGLTPVGVGGHLHFLWLPEEGAGVNRGSSTRITRVSKVSPVEALTHQRGAMVAAAIALDSVGQVVTIPAEPLAPVQAAVLGALAKGFAGERECCANTPVPHDGSRGCKSGSIASGGTRAHCTCDACF